jgi:hypothetical protein
MREASLGASAKSLLKLLPFAGAIPFISGAFLLVINVTTIPLLGSVQVASLTYGLAILSFMAGVHWGQFIAGSGAGSNLLIISNFVTVAAWFGYLILQPWQFAILLMGLFLSVLLVDQSLATKGIIAQDYFKTRALVTLLVILSLAVIAAVSV